MSVSVASVHIYMEGLALDHIASGSCAAVSSVGASGCGISPTERWLEGGVVETRSLLWLLEWNRKGGDIRQKCWVGRVCPSLGICVSVRAR